MKEIPFIEAVFAMKRGEKVWSVLERLDGHIEIRDGRLYGKNYLGQDFVWTSWRNCLTRRQGKWIIIK